MSVLPHDDDAIEGRIEDRLTRLLARAQALTAFLDKLLRGLRQDVAEEMVDDRLRCPLARQIKAWCLGSESIEYIHEHNLPNHSGLADHIHQGITLMPAMKAVQVCMRRLLFGALLARSPQPLRQIVTERRQMIRQLLPGEIITGQNLRLTRDRADPGFDDPLDASVNQISQLR